MADGTEPVQPGAASRDVEEPVGGVREAFLTWVGEHFAVVEYVHTDKRAPWCPEWWRHPEVVARLWALWQARLQADEDSGVRLDAVSEWWLGHWDRHTAVLFDPRTGPFRKCDRTLGHLHETDGTASAAVDVRQPPSEWRLGP